jgi:membrane protein
VTGSAPGSAKAIAAALPQRVREHNLTLVAAGVAFYAFLAFVPALIAFVSIYGLVADPISVTRNVHNIAAALPDEVQRFLVFQLTSIANADTRGVSVTLAIATLVALWSASGGMAALMTGIRIARDQDAARYVRKRARALILTLGTIVFLGAVIFLTTVLPPWVADTGLGRDGRIALGILRWPLLAIVMAVGIGLLYRFAAPDIPAPRFGFLTMGTAIALVGWLAVSALFSVYTANFSRYSKTYGTLASIVVVLLWLWLSSLLILIGAEVDGAIARGASDSPETTP